MTSRELTGQTALITGVSRRAGIGAAIARELGLAGAQLFVTFFRRYDQRQAWGIEADEPESLLQELGSIAQDVAWVELDLAHPRGAADLMRRAAQRYGGIDILVNNAAHWSASSIGDVRLEQLDQHYAVNVRATVMLCAEFARQLEPGRPGRIINITSGQGRGPMPGNLAYAVTKAALDALTLTLSAELASRGVTVNAIDPGPTDTGWISETLRAELLRAPNGRISSPGDIARMVRRLSGDAAAETTGRIIRAGSGGS